MSTKTLSAWVLREYVFEEVVKNKEAIVEALIVQAKKGNIAAIKELFDMALGGSSKLIDEMREAQ